ncbi:hypothetical protein QFZ82_002505 [Streptomyces sp. V4I23]|uniref:hypothetical protein n=1 Tax=Streptomyces sp. V4I23 TaxID=3042282 RepID=UPI00277E480B|nr:hypothetical protein [Streptomyces sp. V4I23]MDQ1008020.1 hypothetical protein [Streptomyces sp. V4I23]
MLALRLTRGAHALVQLRRLLVAAASAGVGFLMLWTLTYALSHPADSRTAIQQLLWCAIPLAATVYFAVAVARTDPGTRPRSGLSAVGLGPAGLTVVAAATTAVAATLGSVVALLFFLHLRGDLSGLPFDGAAADLLAADHPLPPGAVLTLLSLVPVTATAAAAIALRPRPAAEDEAPTSAPTGLPWGVAMIAGGLAVETYASGRPPGHALALPGPIGGHPAGVLAGWVLAAAGLWLAGPALTHVCGRLLQAVRPGATRLLAGRILMAEARCVGRPLGVVCAVASGALAVTALHGDASRPWGPMTALGATLVVACTTASLLTAALEVRQSRTDTTEALLRLGAHPAALRRAAWLRAGALLLLFAPLTLTFATVAAAPLKG